MTDVATPALATRDLTAGYRNTIAVKSVTMEVGQGHIHAIVGPNGSGKSSLIKAVLGLLSGTKGTALFFGGSYAEHRKSVGYMPQAAAVDWDFPITVKEVTLMGTYPRLGWFRRPRPRDLERAREALAQVGLSELAGRHISQLSGGQKQRVFLSRLLAQDAKLLIMDEPFAGVDAASESVIINILKEEAARGCTVVIVHHDLAQVAEFCTHATLLREGEVISTGPVGEALTSEAIAEAFQIGGLGF
ncbi:manganese/zinc/iron transport system ATP- binding protein [Trueperella bonasi]|uniref:Manganese/zinc/iron transport system ATP-binding protein n=1 Tax=Trueperella bonasi TaxID=312286 RepID=A0ABT9NG13_9ACTO|nr:metal ABC transporter ATP-binding protein [Trueperella bonasi]MDP9805978.1 manganese/zinc/iron transport system ATP- binding protein [Trueperella bonasi]